MEQIKAKKIKEALRQTKEKRKEQIPRVYRVKLQNLSVKDKETLDRLFLEAKWLYNYVIADIENRLNGNTWKLKEVEIKIPKGFEKREIKQLSSQMRQGIVERIKRSLFSLKRAKEKGSKRYQKVKEKIRREWEYINNKRKDTLNKVVSYLKKFSLIAIQNDNIKSWKEGYFGKQIQNTGIGGIIARLRTLATLIPVVFVDRYEPTTQICSFCGNRQKVSLSERVFRCQRCGKEIDRDINSARNILRIAVEKLKGEGKLLKTLPVDCGKVTPVERELSLVETGSSLLQ